MSKLHAVSVALFAALTATTAAADNAITTNLSARWMSAYNSGDVKALAAMYAPDARVQHGYCSPVDGRDAIQTFWSNDLAESSAPRTELFVLDSFAAEDVVYLSGKYAVNDTATEPVGGTFMQIWRRGTGSDWSLYRESWFNLACIRVEPGKSASAESGAADIEI